MQYSICRLYATRKHYIVVSIFPSREKKVRARRRLFRSVSTVSSRVALRCVRCICYCRWDFIMSKTQTKKKPATCTEYYIVTCRHDVIADAQR